RDTRASVHEGAVPQTTVQWIGGQATVLFHRTRKTRWIDLVVVLALFGFLFGLMALARQWTGKHEGRVHIDLNPVYLPLYTLYSLSRGLTAYLLSLSFTLVSGYWAAKDRIAERVLVPLLDILQSIPVLGFMPVFFLALVALFAWTGTNIGEELVAILMIFTGQAWNMTFSFYHSLRSIPADQVEAATSYRFTWWQRFKWVELPFATTGVVYNSMMRMAGGWFFLMICESYTPGDTDFRLPGLGSYMSVAWQGEDGHSPPNYLAMLWAILAMGAMIVLLDQLLWNPVVVWAQKFRVEEGAATERASSWVLDLLRHSRLVRVVGLGG